MKVLVFRKASRPNGVITKFYKIFWKIIKIDYLNMITKACKIQHFLLGIMKRLISLLFKSRNWTKLINWQPITLFNVAYKIYAKVLQIHLQSMLIENISFDQSIFSSIQFILNNILFIYKTMKWIEHSKKLLIFLNWTSLKLII